MEEAEARRALPTAVPVLVVGGGPIGLLTSILLDRQGVENVVIERRQDVQPAPAAHVVNARTFEICRAAGLDMERIGSACQPPEEGAWVRWVTSLAGEELGRVPFERQHEVHRLDEVTPTPLRNLSQHRFEPILRDHAPALRTGVEWVAAAQTDDAVVSTVRDIASGETTEIRARYLIAADGAGSPVRRWLGIGMDGPTRLAAFVTIHAEADLRQLVADRPATLYWVIDPDVGGTFVAHDLGSTWVYMHEWDPDVEQIEDYTVERCADLFRRAVGADVELTVRTITPWMMSCQVAERYRGGRVFLVGDAAHRFPPSGGLGLNTGAVDAQNLTWKLAAVEHGWADPEILESYEAERRPVADANAAQSLGNAMKLLEVWNALGGTDDEATTRANYRATLASAAGREGVRLATAGQAEHFDLLGMQLGFTYQPDAGLVADDGTPMPEAEDPVRDYLPTTHPGARLPHAWVERDGELVSTLDLVPPDRFVLLTASEAWAAAGDRLKHGAVPLDVVRMGRDVLDPDAHWACTSDLPASGAILVRPDQHVGWRSLELGREPGDELAAALARQAGR